jgi:hypothetical protein
MNTCPTCGFDADHNGWFCGNSFHTLHLPVVTVSPSSGWPETDLIYGGRTYRYQGNQTWRKEDQS